MSDVPLAEVAREIARDLLGCNFFSDHSGAMAACDFSLDQGIACFALLELPYYSWSVDVQGNVCSFQSANRMISRLTFTISGDRMKIRYMCW